MEESVVPGKMILLSPYAWRVWPLALAHCTSCRKKQIDVFLSCLQALWTLDWELPAWGLLVLAYVEKQKTHMYFCPMGPWRKKSKKLIIVGNFTLFPVTAKYSNPVEVQWPRHGALQKSTCLAFASPRAQYEREKERAEGGERREFSLKVGAIVSRLMNRMRTLVRWE